MELPVRYFRRHVRIQGRLLSSSLQQDLTCSSVQRCSLPAPASLVWTAGCPLRPQSLGHPLYCLQSLVIPCTVCSLLVIPCTVCSLWSSLHCLQSLVISCTISAVSGHLLYYVRSLWSSPVLCPQSLVISCTMSAV
ncbi:unnamed protein product, partial [Staurois parvus]